MNNKKTLKTIVKLAVVAAIYVALTLALYPLSYGSIQFRLSEFLMLLVSYNPLYAISLSVGCLLANIASPMGVIDVIFGTLATVLACIPMIFVKRNKYLTSLFPSIVNAIVIGLELQYAYAVPFYLGAIEVFVGEFVVVSLIGVPVFKAIEKNSKLVELLDLKLYDDDSNLEKYLNPRTMISLALCVIGFVLFFKLGINYAETETGTATYALSYFTFDNGGDGRKWIIIVMFMPLLSLISAILLNRKTSFILNTIFDVIAIVVMIVGLTSVFKFVGSIDWRFYFYFVYFALSIGYEIVAFILYEHDFKKEEPEALEASEASNFYSEVEENK